MTTADGDRAIRDGFVGVGCDGGRDRAAGFEFYAVLHVDADPSVVGLVLDLKSYSHEPVGIVAAPMAVGGLTGACRRVVVDLERLLNNSIQVGIELVGGANLLTPRQGGDEREPWPFALSDNGIFRSVYQGE